VVDVGYADSVLAGAMDKAAFFGRGIPVIDCKRLKGRMGSHGRDNWDMGCLSVQE
jgi:hypothetical protein